MRRRRVPEAQAIYQAGWERDRLKLERKGGEHGIPGGIREPGGLVIIIELEVGAVCFSELIQNTFQKGALGVVSMLVCMDVWDCILIAQVVHAWTWI